MSIRRERLKYNGQDLKLKITLSDKTKMSGYQQEINNISNEIANQNINAVTDTEKRKYSLNDLSPLIMTFYFTTGSSTSYTSATFTQYEISAQTNNFKNSFYILDFFNDYDPNKQTKIFSTYLTKLESGTTYNISSIYAKQFYYWYVPQWYINENSGSTLATGYTRFSFFNAKTGELCQFMNEDIHTSALSASTKLMYFETEIDFENKTWDFAGGTNFYGRKLDNTYYSNRINDAVNKLDNKLQVFPTGDTHLYTTNMYSGSTQQ